jgi:ribosomal protein S18 acetylase RimI-like enzyme
MTYDGDPPPWPEEVDEVDVADLRPDRLEMWRADADSEAVAQELADMQVAFGSYPGARALGVRRNGAFVAWAQVAEGCIDDVHVVPARRGRGLGRTVTRAALAAGGWFLFTDVGDPRPQTLYRSLGFTDAGRVVQLTRHV